MFATTLIELKSLHAFILHPEVTDGVFLININRNSIYIDMFAAPSMLLSTGTSSCTSTSFIAHRTSKPA